MAEGRPKRTAQGLSFAERRRFDDLPSIVARLEAEISKLQDFLATPDLFAAEPAKARKATEMLADRQEALAAAETEWLILADRA
jgi:ATP-binding cassette subfamily F protein uup